MQAVHYAQALYQATRGKDDAAGETAVTNLVRVMQTAGHIRLLPKVLRAYEEISRKRQTSTDCVVRVAREADLTRYNAHIERDIATLQAASAARKTVIDDTIIGGYEVRAKGNRIDRTHKRTLVTLFETLKRAE